MLEQARSLELIANFQRRLDNGTISGERTNETTKPTNTHTNTPKLKSKTKEIFIERMMIRAACFDRNVINFVC